MIVIDRLTPYEDRGLTRTRIEWHDEKGTGVADTHCSVTGIPLGDTYLQCIAHCQLYGHFSAQFDVFLHQTLRSHGMFSQDEKKRQNNERAFQRSIEVWIQGNSIYPQSTTKSDEKGVQ